MNEFTAILINFGALLLKIIPILIGAVYLAETARLWLGRERLRKLLMGSGSRQGIIRAALLGAAVPFCECGAFPIIVALLRAGVPMKVALTFFIISPMVSIPAFLFLITLFSLPMALLYLAITVFLGLTAAAILTYWADEQEVVKRLFLRESTGVEPNCCDAGKGGEVSCCSTPHDDVCSSGSDCCDDTPSESKKNGSPGIFIRGVRETASTMRGLLPLAAAAIFIASLVESVVPEALIEGILGFAAPFDVAIAAAAGVPIYTGDCTMFALVAPFIEVTGAVGPGIAFIIAGAGTSISGLMFMSALFTRRFLAAFVISVFLIALTAGYILGFVF